MMTLLNEDTYDEINQELRAMALSDHDARPRNRILIGSGEDCQYVLFGGNYKPCYKGE